MTEARLSLGRWGEEEACRFLCRQGMEILERNFRTPVGEIDIIARFGRLLIFVEVKTRRSSSFGPPQASVGPAKQRQIVRTAQWYLGNRKGRELQPRFDVIAVRPTLKGVDIDHIPDAFGV